LILFSVVCLSQSKFNIVCRDFTFEKEVSSAGKNLRNIFEAVISKSKYPFVVLEREKMDKIFESLQEEKNLVRDLSSEWKSKLQLASIDYLVVGDLTENISQNNYTLVINFLKVSGEKATQKLPLVIVLERKMISNNEDLIKVFNKEIDAFVGSYFITDQVDNLLTIPAFHKELLKRDSTINMLNTSVRNLEQQNFLKDKQIEKLNNDVNGIKNYSHVAELDIWGLGRLKGGNTISITNPTNRLMKNILEQKDGMISIKSGDSILTDINKVIEISPDFPFGYWAKAQYLIRDKKIEWVVFARKAVTILEVTTTIAGHDGYHDAVLKGLKELLKINGF
jgi:hypothetical protein